MRVKYSDEHDIVSNSFVIVKNFISLVWMPFEALNNFKI